MAARAATSDQTYRFNIVLGGLLGMSLSLNHVLIDNNADQECDKMLKPLRKQWENNLYAEVVLLFNQYGSLGTWRWRGWAPLHTRLCKWIQFHLMNGDGRYNVRGLIEADVEKSNWECQVPILQMQTIIDTAYTQMAQFRPVYQRDCPEHVRDREDAAELTPYQTHCATLDLLEGMIGLPSETPSPVRDFLKTAWRMAFPAMLLTLGAAAAVACSHGHKDHVLPIVGAAVNLNQGQEQAENHYKQSSLVLLKLFQRITSTLEASLPLSLQKQIAKNDNRTRCLIGHDGDSASWSLMLRRRCLLLSLQASERNNIVLQHHRFPGHRSAQENQRIAQIDEDVEVLLNSYPAVQRQLTILIDLIRSNSVSRNPTCIQAYLHGPAGNGKTHLVEALGRALQTPVFRIKGKTLATMERLCNPLEDAKQSDWEDREKTDENLLSTLGWAMVEKGVNNPIVFIDEVQSLMDPSTNSPMVFMVNDQLKILLNCGNTRILDLSTLIPNYRINVTRVTVVLAGTKPMETMDAPLSSRFLEISFDPLTMSSKEAILTRQLDVYKPQTFLADRQLDSVKSRVRTAIPKLVRASVSCELGGIRELQLAVHSLCSKSDKIECDLIAQHTQGQSTPSADIFDDYLVDVVQLFLNKSTDGGSRFSEMQIRLILFPERFPEANVAPSPSQETVQNFTVEQEEQDFVLANRRAIIDSVNTSPMQLIHFLALFFAITSGFLLALVFKVRK